MQKIVLLVQDRTVEERILSPVHWWLGSRFCRVQYELDQMYVLIWFMMIYLWGTYGWCRYSAASCKSCWLHLISTARTAFRDYSIREFLRYLLLLGLFQPAGTRGSRRTIHIRLDRRGHGTQSNSPVFFTSRCSWTIWMNDIITMPDEIVIHVYY